MSKDASEDMRNLLSSRETFHVQDSPSTCSINTAHTRCFPKTLPSRRQFYACNLHHSGHCTEICLAAERVIAADCLSSGAP